MTHAEPRSRFVQAVDRTPLLELGYKVPLDGVWPAGAFTTANPDWWRDPDAWIERIADQLSATWTLIAPQIDDVLADNQQVSGG